MPGAGAEAASVKKRAGAAKTGRLRNPGFNYRYKILKLLIGEGNIQYNNILLESLNNPNGQKWNGVKSIWVNKCVINF